MRPRRHNPDDELRRLERAASSSEADWARWAHARTRAGQQPALPDVTVRIGYPGQAPHEGVRSVVLFPYSPIAGYVVVPAWFRWDGGRDQRFEVRRAELALERTPRRRRVKKGGWRTWWINRGPNAAELQGIFDEATAVHMAQQLARDAIVATAERRNPDDELRRLERAAASGDPEAVVHYRRAMVRAHGRGWLRQQPPLLDQLVVDRLGVHPATVWLIDADAGVALFSRGSSGGGYYVVANVTMDAPGAWTVDASQKPHAMAPHDHDPVDKRNLHWVQDEARRVAELQIRHGRFLTNPPEDLDRAVGALPLELRVAWAALPDDERTRREWRWYMYWTQVVRHRPGAAQGALFTLDQVPAHLRNPRRNPDDRLRELERRAAGGDPLARQELVAWRVRSGLPVERRYLVQLVGEVVRSGRVPAIRDWPAGTPFSDVVYPGAPLAAYATGIRAVLHAMGIKARVIAHGTRATGMASEWDVVHVDEYETEEAADAAAAALGLPERSSDPLSGVARMLLYVRRLAPPPLPYAPPGGPSHGPGGPRLREDLWTTFQEGFVRGLYGKRRNPDERIRELERRAAGGDPLAAQELAAWRTRTRTWRRRYLVDLVEDLRVQGRVQQHELGAASTYAVGVRSVLGALGLRTVDGRSASRGGQVGAVSVRALGPGHVLVEGPFSGYLGTGAPLPEETSAVLREAFGVERGLSADWLVLPVRNRLQARMNDFDRSGPLLREDLWPAFQEGFLRGLQGKRKNPGTDDRARRAARSGDPIAVIRERLRAGLVTPEQVAWAEALTWKPRSGGSTLRTRPGNFVRRGLVPFEEGLTELVGRGALIRWHMQDADAAYDYMSLTPTLNLMDESGAPTDAIAVFEADGSAYGDWQVMAVDSPDNDQAERFQAAAAAAYAANVTMERSPWTFNDPAAWWFVATRLLPAKDRAAIATVTFMAVHNPIHAWELFRGWWRQYVVGPGVIGDESATYTHASTQYRELDEDLRGLVIHLLGGPT